MIRIETSDLPIPPVVEFEQKHTVLTGSNGRGKSTVLSCMAACITGYSVGGGDMTVRSRTGKPRIDVFLEGKRVERDSLPIHDLRLLSSMTGPQRAQYLFELLGGQVSSDEIRKAINEAAPPHLMASLARVFGAKDIEYALMTVNAMKKESEKSLDGLRALTATAIDMDKHVAISEKARVEDILSDKFAEERTKCVEEIQALRQELGDKADQDIGNVHFAIADLKREKAELADRIAIQQDEVNRLQGQCSSYRSSMRTLNGACKCPVCQQAISPELTQVLNGTYEKLNAAYKASSTDLNAMQTDFNEIKAEIGRGEQLQKKLARLFDLHGMLEVLPQTKHSAKDVQDARDRLNELKAVISAHEQRESASAQISRTDEECKCYRAVETGLKKLKATAAQKAGFPPQVLQIVQDVLGMEMSFGKVGRTQDIIVKHGTEERPIGTLSAGEWQVVAAAFGTMEPTALVLVEAAEIDDTNFTRLLDLLSKHPGIVIVADWRTRPVPKGWAVKEMC